MLPCLLAGDAPKPKRLYLDQFRPRSELKAILLPSGENDGEVSIDGSVVMRVDDRLRRSIR